MNLFLCEIFRVQEKGMLLQDRAKEIKNAMLE